MSEPLLAEDVALLLLDDTSGWLRGQFADYALAGAVATELALRGRIRLTERGERDVRPDRVMVTDATPTDDEILDAGLRRLAERPIRFRSTTVQLLRKDLKRQILERLVTRGVVEARPHKVFGLVPITVHPTIDPTYEQGLRARLFAVLVKHEEPTVRDACIIATLDALGMAHRIVAEDVSTVDRRAIRTRARQLRKVHWAAETAARLIQQQQAAAS